MFAGGSAKIKGLQHTAARGSIVLSLRFDARQAKAGIGKKRLGECLEIKAFGLIGPVRQFEMRRNLNDRVNRRRTSPKGFSPMIGGMIIA